ncbi:MAG: tRNA (adenosine(37)-N6)-dimethylallyltransferase MiaA [Alphaproteobacteria bacterium]
MARPAILLCGPTSGGKSALALALAQTLAQSLTKTVGAVVINADAMQIYRELRILTARPSLQDEAGIPHRLYGAVAGDQRFSVGRWLERVAAEIGIANAQGLVPIIVGGTGLYFNALLNGLAPIPEIPSEIRTHWAKVGQAGGVVQLARELARLDPQMAARLEPGDTQRIVRALEVMTATGRSLADWQQRPTVPVLRAQQSICLVLAPPRPTIHARIAQRAGLMLAGGAVDEVRALLDLKLDADLPVMKAIGVAEITRMISGDVDLATTTINIATATRRYAKRQLTWARKYMAEWRWVDAVNASVVDEIAAQAATFDA